MIYSKKIQSFVPVTVNSTSWFIRGLGTVTKYTVKDGKIPVGYVNLHDTKNGVHVSFINNQFPDLYSGFGKLADQIEVEHCLNRGLSDFDILSKAALNSHALHYLRGKRFYDKDAEAKIKQVISETPKGQAYNTRFLGEIAMYMPKELIQKYVEIIKKSPLILKK